MLFNEPKLLKSPTRSPLLPASPRFSALQRAEIAEIQRIRCHCRKQPAVSVLFNEPKLLKLENDFRISRANGSFSALQRAEIAEIAGGA